jgi:hypothetical protein
MPMAEQNRAAPEISFIARINKFIASSRLALLTGSLLLGIRHFLRQQGEPGKARAICL